MNQVVAGAGAVLLLSTSLANAGALDRTGQPIDVLFEEGNYAELSFSFTSPDVQGRYQGPSSDEVVLSSDVAEDFGLAALSFKSDLNDQFSLAVVIDQPFGADVDYGNADPGYPIGGSTAEFDTLAVTALGRYKLNENFSLHAGARFVQVKADLFSRVLTPLGPYTYEGTFETDETLGFVVGAAYERPDIALRVALTYSSETSFSHETTFTETFLGGSIPGPSDLSTEYTLPRSVNLDFQTGIAAGTLLFGSIRWADWSETEIEVPGYDFNPVVSYDDDYITYTLGVGRQFTDKLAASAAVIYEPSIGREFSPADAGSGISNLAPTDGQLGVQLAASYALTDQVEVGAGVRYTKLGGGSTRFFGADFDDNHAVTAGVQIGYRF